MRFRVRLPAHEIRLISGSASPAELTGSPDDRRLGVLLRRLCWVKDGEAIEVPVDSPGFIDGFHRAEIHKPGDAPVRWTTGDAALPPALFPPWQGEVLLDVSLSEWRGSAHAASASAEARLLGAFEGLGEDCEFGLVQRRYLVEPPLSLYRWAGTPVDNLIRGLDSGFSGLGDPDQAELVWDGREYFVRTPFATMHTKCNVAQDEAGMAEVLRGACATLRILRRKLLKDIADARRVFVFKSLDPAFDGNGMRRLHASLRRLGPASLLCVKVARVGRRAGSAERLADGLYAGYLQRFSMVDPSFGQWLSICGGAMTLHGRDRTRDALHAGPRRVRA